MATGGSPRELALELAGALREEVAPLIGAHAGRAHAGAGEGGDITFAIDERAEAFMESFLAERAPWLAFYSEDRGLVSPGGEAEWVLVVDPIDGTRPALAGFEAACTAVAIAPVGDGDPRMRDVVAGCVMEVKTGAWFLAARGEGCEASVPIGPSRAAD